MWLRDCNPPLPCLLALFAEGDSVEACFNEEAEGMLEVTPEPNLIIPFDPTNTDAPYWNTDSRGLVCAGSMRVPESSDIASIPAWQDAYFQSQFTHAAGAVWLTSHPGGFIGLWKSLAGRKSFPVLYLIDAGETLQEFVAQGSER